MLAVREIFVHFIITQTNCEPLKVTQVLLLVVNCPSLGYLFDRNRSLLVITYSIINTQNAGSKGDICAFYYDSNKL